MMLVDVSSLSDRIRSFSIRHCEKLFVPRSGWEYGTRGAEWAWKWGYFDRAASRIYCATGDQEILELFQTVHDQFVGFRDDRLGMIDEAKKEIIPAWGTILRSRTRTSLRACDVATNGLILLPFTDLLLRAKPNQLSDDLRAGWTQTVTTTLDALCDDFHEDKRSGGGFFIQPFDNKVEPLNHQHLFGAALAEAWRLTGKSTYREIARKLYRYFRHHWYFEKNDTVSWAYRPSPDASNIAHLPMSYDTGLRHNLGAEFFYKAAVTIELPVAMCRVGLLPKSDLLLITKSIDRNVILPENRLNYYISPRKRHCCSDVITGEAPILRPHYFFSFVLLSRFSIDFYRKFLEISLRRRDLFPRDWLSGPPGSLAVAEIFHGNPALGRQFPPPGDPETRQ